MFNVRSKALIPWLHIAPPPADEVPGFRMNPDGSIRNAQRGAASNSFGIGMTPATHADAAHALGQPNLKVPTLGSELLAQSTLPTGLPGFRAGLRDDVPGFDLRVESAPPSFNPIGNGSDGQLQETNWLYGTQLEAATAPTPPLSVNNSTQLLLPQLSERLAAIPVPQLSTAFDPQTRRRIVPYEPLIGPVTSYLVTDENSRGMRNIHPSVGSIGSLPDLKSPKSPTAEQQASPESPVTDINIGRHTTTEPAAEPKIGSAWPHASMDTWPHAETGAAAQEIPWPADVMPHAAGVAPGPSVQHATDSNFILANASDADHPQPEQPVLPPEDQPTVLDKPVTPAELHGVPPERQAEQARSRSLEDYRRQTAEEIEALVSAIGTFGNRIYEDSILKVRDDLARLAERLRNDPAETVLSILNSFPPTRVEGKLVGGLAAVVTILANAKRGLDFERAVLHALNAASLTTEATKNTTKIAIEGLGRSVPDVLRRGIREIKSGVEINNSTQLRVQAAYARLFKVPLSLIVSPATQRISKSVIDAVRETGGTIQRFDPATGVFTPFQ